ncbi:MAG: sodium:solute symporter family protein [Deltaproteobacteria bacterium]|nr:sodium:solute symporter family protein [Deltaproteobacteria bacterium]
MITVAVYMLIMIAVGVYFRNRAKTIEDFYLSGRQLSCGVVMLTFAATWIGASATLAKSGLAYKVGFSALSPTFATVFALLIFSFLSPRIRRIGANYGITSIPDLFHRRFGKLISLLASIIITVTLLGTVATQMVATSNIFQVLFKPYGTLSYEVALVLSLVVVVGYTILAGFYAVVWTDVIQGLILLVIIGVFLPLAALDMAGGWRHVGASLPDDFFSLKPNMTLIGYSWVYLLYFLSGPPYWQRAFASKSERTARWGTVGGNVIIFLYSVGVTLIGVCAAVIYPVFPTGISHEMLIPLMAHERFHPFIYELVIVALMSVLMSTINSYLILAAQTISNDVYKLVRPNATEQSRLRSSKWMIVFLGMTSLVFSLNIRIILEALVFAYTFFSSAIAFPALGALMWRRATKQGVLCSMVGGLVMALSWSYFGHPLGLHEAIPGGLMSLLVMIIVSSITYDQNNPSPYFN